MGATGAVVARAGREGSARGLGTGVILLLWRGDHASAREEALNATNASQPGPDRPRRRRLWKRVAIGLAVVVVLIVAFVGIFGPAVAGTIGRGIAERKVSAAIPGHVEIASVSLGWSRNQRIGPVRVFDAAGDQVAEVSIENDASLISLARMNLGTTRLTGFADVVADADGTTNLEKSLGVGRAAAPAPAGSSSAPRLPSGLRGRVVVDAVRVSYTDRSLAGQSGSGTDTFVLDDVQADVSVAVGGVMEGTVRVALLAGRSDGSVTDDAGSLTAEWSVRDWSNGQGQLTLDSMALAADVAATDLGVAVADVVVGQQGRLVEALGQRASLTLDVDGGLADASARVAFRSDGATTTATLRYAQQALSVAEPIEVTLETDRLLALAPDVRAMLERDQVAQLDAAPSVRVLVDDFRLPVSLGQVADVNLQSASVHATLETSEARGRVALGGAGSVRETLGVAPVRIEVSSTRLADGVQVVVGTRAEIGEKPAGELNVDLEVSGLLDDAGRPITGRMPQVSGVVELSGFSTAIAHPFAEALKVDLGRAVGERVSIRVNASPEAGATRVRLAGEGTNVQLDGSVLVSPTLIEGEGDALTLRIVELSPAIEGLLAERGIELRESGEPGGLRFVATDFRVDVGQLMGGETGMDFTAVRGRAVVELDGLSGELSKPRPEMFAIAASSVSIDASDPGAGARVVVSSGLEWDGAPAGTLHADISARGVLDGTGAIRGGLPERFEVDVSIDGASPRVARALTEPLGLDLARDLGASVDLRLVASGDASRPGEIPDGTIVLQVEAEHARIDAPLVIRGGVLRSAESPVVVRLSKAGAMASGVVAADSAWRVAPRGSARVELSGIAVPFDGVTRAPVLDQASGAAVVSLTKVRVERAGDGRKPVDIPELGLRLDLAKGFEARLRPEGIVHHDTLDGVLGGDLTISGAASVRDGRLVVHPGEAELVGDLSALGLPTSLARLFLPEVEPAAPDLAEAIRVATGEALDVELAARRVEAGNDLDVKVTSDGLRATAKVRVAADAIELRDGAVISSLTPERASNLIAAVAPASSQQVTVASPTEVRVALAPMRVVRGEGLAIDPGSAGVANLTITAKPALRVAGLARKGPDGEAVLLGPVGLGNLELVGVAPLAGLLDGPGGIASKATVTLTSDVLIEGDLRVATLDVLANCALLGETTLGRATAEAKIEKVNMTALDRYVGQGGQLVELVGGSSKIVVDADANLARLGETTSEAFARASLEVIASNLETTGPMRLDVAGDRIALAEPASLVWTASAEALSPLLLGKDRHDGARVVDATTVDVSLDRLTIARGAGAFQPDVFAVSLQVLVPALSVETPTGRVETLQNLSLIVTSSANAGELHVEAKLNAQPEDSTHIDAQVTGFADAQGVLTAGAARVTANGQVPSFPTAVVDMLARQKGLLSEVLGPTISLDLVTRDLSRSEGTLSLVASSPRADAQVSVRMEEGLMRASPVKATLHEISPALSARLVKGLPSIGKFEKTREDEPGRVDGTDVTVGLNGDLRKLNGDIRLDLGEVQFATSSAFSELLSVVGTQQAGVAGRRVKPIAITIRNGVITYAPFEVPLGEFIIVSSGTINLVSKDIDIVTKVPLGAVTDEALGQFRLGIKNQLDFDIPGFGQFSLRDALDRATMMPFRTTGTLGGQVQTKAAPGLLSRGALDAISNAIMNQGGQLLNDVIDLFGGGG